MESDKKISLFGWLAILLILFLVGFGVVLFFQQDSGQKVVETKKQAFVATKPTPKPPAATKTDDRVDQGSLRLTLAETIRMPKPPLHRSVQPESPFTRPTTTAQASITKSTERPKTQPVEMPKTQPVAIPKTQPVEIPKTQPVEMPKTQPVAIPKTQPVEIPKTQPVEIPKTQPVEIPKTQPVEVPTPSSRPPVQMAEQPVALDKPSVGTDILYEEPLPETDKKLSATPPSLQEAHKARTPNTLALIIDDLGYHFPISSAIVALPFDITLAILPGVPHAREIARLGQQAGREILLHQPMEPRQYPHINPGPGVILSGMERGEIQTQLRANLALFPEVVGINNHMGSRLTEQEDAMGAVMSVLSERRLFFIDSRTSNHSVAQMRALSDGVPTASRDIFIDNVQSERAILHQLTQMERMARKRGDVIGIGHPYRETLAALRQWLPTLSKKGIRLVRVSRLLYPHSARAHYPDRVPVLQKANIHASPDPLHAADRDGSH